MANGKLLKEKIFENIWIQPAAGDAGSAVGVALGIYYEFTDESRQLNGNFDGMSGSYLGPSYTDDEIETTLDRHNAKYHKENDNSLFSTVANALKENNVVGWFQGRMEFGPRSLGNRSILGNPMSTEMQSILNLKIKYRESFRPFAPAVLKDDVNIYFETINDSPYMLFVAPIVEGKRIKLSVDENNLFGIDKLKIPRSEIPAVTHVDYSARVQTVTNNSNPKFYRLIQEFKKLTDCSVLVNTSFNVRDEPIVCSPDDAYRCFMATEMDLLVLNNHLLWKNEQ